ncbi:MAG: hypothetical protein D6806_18105 [Deltaproteobacteria bacterium]|nr:MAG: hypothetical protein D6806_18105 [Deltaproteobacteria bacterium]
MKIKSVGTPLCFVIMLFAANATAQARMQWDESGQIVSDEPAAPDEAFDSEQQPPPEQGGDEGYGYVYEEPDQQVPPEQAPEDTSYFFDKLSPYGDWIWTPEYGWVWKPRGVWAEWRPYTYGRWVYTEYGWTWVSFFDWGWAPFHYGSWAYLSSLGWVWVPGTVWAPAWVIWRYSDTYIGWAPMLAGFGLWFGWGYYPVVYEYWTFIHWDHFCDPHPHHHYLPRRQAGRIFRRTMYPRACRNRSGMACIRGPAANLVERRARVAVKRLKVVNVARLPRSASDGKRLGVAGNRVRIFRPNLSARSAPTFKARPRRSTDLGIIPNQPARRAHVPAAPTGPANTFAPSNRPVWPRPQPGKTISPQQPARHLPRVPSGRLPQMRKSGPLPRLNTPSRAPMEMRPSPRPVLPPTPVKPSKPAAKKSYKSGNKAFTPVRTSRPRSFAPRRSSAPRFHRSGGAVRRRR